jgi:hypothetical protein
VLLQTASTRALVRAAVVLPGTISIDDGRDRGAFLPDMRTHFGAAATHLCVGEAVGNIEGTTEATLVGHGLIGRINTGQGSEFFPVDASTHLGLDNDLLWERRIGEMRTRSLRRLMLFSCGTGANDDGALLLFKLARALQATVYAPTGDVWFDVTAREPSIVETADWQVADWSMSEPPPAKPHHTLQLVPLVSDSLAFVVVNGTYIPVPLGAVQRVEFAVRNGHVAEISARALAGNEAVDFTRRCGLNAPFAFGGPPASLVTGRLQVTVGVAGREFTSEYLVHDNRLLESVAVPGEFFQIREPGLLVA